MALAAHAPAAFAQTSRANSDFTYQGRVDLGGVPFSGTLVVRATLFREATGGVPVAAAVEQQVNAVDGLITLPLDFGSVEAALAPCFVEIAVRPLDEPDFTVLSPRQALAGVPVAGTADRALTTDLINASASRAYTLVASQDDASGLVSSTTQWQAFSPSESGRLTLLTVARRGTLPTSSARLRIYQGEGTGGAVLHEQFSEVPSAGETVFSIAPRGVSLVAGQVYTWEINTPGTLVLGRSQGDPSPLPSSLGSFDYAFRAYIGEVGSATLRASRVGVGVPSPIADLHVRGIINLDHLRVDSTNLNGTWLNLSNINTGSATWSLVSTGPQNGEGAGKLLIRNSTGPAPSLVMETNGVGIGISSPQSTLHVVGGGDASLSTGGILQLGSTTSANLVFDANEIMARFNSGPADISLNGEGGAVGIGSGPFAADFHINRARDATLVGGGLAQIGPSNAANLVMDGNDLFARVAGQPGDLALNAPGGNVGIGAPPFAAALHVNRTGDASLANGGPFQIGSSAGANLVMDSNEIMARSGTAANDLAINAEGGNVGVGFGPFAATFHVTRGGNVSQNEPGFARFGSTNSTNLSIDTNEIQVLNNGAPASLSLNFAGGGVQIGNVAATTGSNVLILNGNASKPGGGLWAAVSDRRAKTDVAPLSGTLDRLLSLHGYSFRYTDRALTQGGATPGIHVGLMAQEVQGVFPEWVFTDGFGRLNVAERGITALMVEALRDLRAEKDRADADARERLDDAAARIRALEAQNAALVRRLERLEQAAARSD
jgi:hypothetical protein